MATESSGPSDQPEQRTLSDAQRHEQLKLIYDYVKFHLVLYVGTPAALTVVAQAFEIDKSRIFKATLLAVIAILLVAGADAGLFMSRHINEKWRSDYLDRFEAQAFTNRRRNMHHSLYWVAMGLGLFGLISSMIVRWYRYGPSGG